MSAATADIVLAANLQPIYSGHLGAPPPTNSSMAPALCRCLPPPPLAVLSPPPAPPGGAIGPVLLALPWLHPPIPFQQAQANSFFHPLATARAGSQLALSAGFFHGQQLPPAAASYQYAQGLEAAQARIGKSHSSSWLAKQQRVEHAFQAWLNSTGLSWPLVTPWDIVVFMEHV